jgi:preprotein translocase subunit SecF
MEFFRIKKDIPFMRNALLFNAVSALTFVAAVFFLFANGLHLSIEFTGGTVMEVAYTKPADLESIRATVTRLGFEDNQVQSFGTAQYCAAFGYNTLVSDKYLFYQGVMKS